MSRHSVLLIDDILPPVYKSLDNLVPLTFIEASFTAVQIRRIGLDTVELFCKFCKLSIPIILVPWNAIVDCTYVHCNTHDWSIVLSHTTNFTTITYLYLLTHLLTYTYSYLLLTCFYLLKCTPWYTYDVNDTIWSCQRMTMFCIK